MSAIDLHPEELIDRHLRGQLAPEERARLDAHCAACVACAMEIALAEAPPEPSAEDVALVEGLLDEVVAASAPRRVGRPWLAVAASIAVLLLSFGTGAYAAVRMGWLPNPLAAEEPAPTPTPRTERARPASPVEEPEPAPEPEPEAVEPVLEPEVEATPEPEAERPATPRASAEDLYARANAARRGGESRRALRLYGELTRQHPRSRQAHAAQVAAGNLALHQLSQPAVALRHYDRYLRTGGPLSLEAGVGRALALQRLGRRAAERRAWQEVLDRHPSSVHAERARRRLEALR